MIYQTTLKSLNPPTSAEGKQLQFIGNFPCKVGDTVWTDGNVIFGHRSIRSTPIVPIYDDDVVPCICTDIQGYFDLNGNFHQKNLPVSSRFVNDNKHYYLPYVSTDSTYASSDREIATDEHGKTIGARYMVWGYDSPIINVYKNNDIEATYNIEDIIKPTIMAHYAQVAMGEEKPVIGFSSAKLFIDKNGDWYAYCYAYALAEVWLASGMWGYVYANPVVFTCYYIKNGAAQELYVTKGRKVDFAGSIFESELTRLEERYGIPYSTADIASESLRFPLQDGYSIRYRMEASISIRPYTTSSDYHVLRQGDLLVPNIFDIFDKDGNVVVSVNRPEMLPKGFSNSYAPFNIAIVKLKDDKHLLSFQGSGIYTYSKADGLLPWGKISYQSRLRKMKKRNLDKFST